MEFLTGWDVEREEADLKALMDYQEYCGEQFLVQWSDVRDKIYEEAKLHKEWNIVHPLCNYTVAQTKTNGCVSYGVSAGVEDGLCLARQKRKEVEIFRCCAPWLYGGYHTLLRGVRVRADARWRE